MFPLFHSTQIRSQSKASRSGLCEGDEVVSINGNPCADLTYPQVIKLMESITDSLQMFIKRYKTLVWNVYFLLKLDENNYSCYYIYSLSYMRKLGVLCTRSV